MRSGGCSASSSGSVSRCWPSCVSGVSSSPMPNALRLYAVTANDHGHPIPENGAGEGGPGGGGGRGGTELVAFGDLAAIVGPTDYLPAPVTGEALEGHGRVVDRAFMREPVWAAA